MAHARPHVVAPFSPNPDFDFEIRTVLGAAVAGASEPGEVLAAVAGIGHADHEGWYAAWAGLGERALASAEALAAAGQPVSAAGAFLRGSHYWSVALNAVSALADLNRLAPAFAQVQRGWAGFVEHTSARVEPVSIPLDDDAMPGWFFRPAAPAAGAPTIVAVNGSDGSLASLWASCVSPALERGFAVLVFDGPGQQSQLFEHGIPFRPDWEAVLTPVYDAVAALPGVDPGRIALYGISQGGYWVARALAFEHRFAAAITDPGVVDVSTSWLGHLPKHLVAMLDDGRIEQFDREMAIGLRFEPEVGRTWAFRARPYGTTGYGETIQAVRQYTVADLAGRITTPLLILSPEGEQFWPGQSQRLAELTPGVSELVAFTAAEGADGHCQPLGRTLTAERMLGWLQQRLA